MNELTKDQIDVLGEIANISMGNAATTLSMMVRTLKRVVPGGNIREP